MAFNIMDLFGPAATNRLLQPAQNAEGVAGFTPPAGNRLINPSGLGGATPGLMPQGNDPWAGLRQPTVDPMTVAGTENGGAAPVMGSMGVAQPAAGAQQPKQGFWDKAKGFLGSDHMQDVFNGWMMGGNDWQKSLAYGGMMSAQGKKSRGEQNQTVDWLRRQGMEEGEAKLLAGNPNALQQYLVQRLKPKDPMTVSKGAAIYDPNTGQWITPPGGGGADATEYGLNPQTGVDAEGNPVLIQIGKDGTATQTKMPEGVTLSKEPIKMDAGTHVVLLDPVTRQPVGQVPKNLVDTERDKAEGKNLGDARGALPQIEASAAEILSSIESLERDPYLDSMVGSVQGRLPNLSSNAARVQSKMDQIGGQSFMQAFNNLRGAGQITEQEGAKATAAMARLNTAMSEADYREALNELRGVVERAVGNARGRAGGAGGQAGASGSVDDLLKKYGAP